MTIRFEVCPYHEPHPGGYERTLVVDTFTRRFKCAACDAEGTLLASGALPPSPEDEEPKARIGKFEPLVNPVGAEKVTSVQVYEISDEFWDELDREQNNATP